MRTAASPTAGPDGARPTPGPPGWSPARWTALALAAGGGLALVGWLTWRITSAPPSGCTGTAHALWRGQRDLLLVVAAAAAPFVAAALRSRHPGRVAAAGALACAPALTVLALGLGPTAGVPAC